MLQGGRALRPRGARDAEPAVPLSSAGRARRPSASRSVGLRQDRRGGRAPRQRLQGRAGGAESGPPAHAGPGDHASGGLASGDTRTPHWRRQNPGQLQGQGLDRGGRRGRPPWPRLRGAAAEPEAGSPAIGGCGGCRPRSERASRCPKRWDRRPWRPRRRDRRLGIRLQPPNVGRRQLAQPRGRVL